MMQPSAFLTRSAARASGLYLGYALGMGVLCLGSLKLSSELIQTLAAGLGDMPVVEDRALSRVEKRLEAMARIEHRVANVPHRVVLAYAVPKMHPLQLAKAMDQTEQAAALHSAPSAKLERAATLDVWARGAGDPVPVAHGPVVAGFMAAAVSSVAGDIASEISSEVVQSKSDRRSARRSVKASGKTKSSEKRKAKSVAGNSVSGLKSPSDSVRVVDTPGAIIRRQLGGTT